MPVYVSPGVYTREIDLSLYIPQLSTTIMGMVGTTQKGPTNERIFVSNVQKFVEIFGNPHPNHLSTYAALQFLREGNQLIFVRVNGSTASIAETPDILGDAIAPRITGSQRGPFEITEEAPASLVGTNTDATVDIDSTNKQLMVSVNGSPSTTIVLTEGAGTTKAAIIAEIDAALAPLGASASGADAFNGGDANAVAIFTDDDGASQRIELLPIANSAYSDLGLTTGTYNGENDNADFKIVAIDTEGAETPLTGTLTAGASRTTDQVVAELNTAFTGGGFPAVASNVDGSVSVVHGSVGKRYGLRWEDPAPADGTIVSPSNTLGFTNGEETYGRGVSPAAKTLKVKANSSGVWGNELAILVETGSTSGSFKLSVLHKNVLVETFDNLVGASTKENKDLGLRFFATVIEDSSQYIDVVSYDTNDGHPLPGTYKLTGGDDGLESVSEDDYIGVVTGADRTGLQLLAKAEDVDVNLISVPGVFSAAVINEMITLCRGRGDCMALVDPPLGLTVQQAVDWHNGVGAYNDHQSFNSSYAALYWPWCKIFDAFNDRYIWTPPSGHISAVYAYSDRNSEVWFAPAGFIRGRVEQVTEVEYSPDQGERDFLYGNQNAINPIVKFNKDGIAVWGQRTLQRAPTALDRVNVRRLLLYLRKVIATSVRYLVFEPNDEVTWRRFVNLVDPYLRTVQARRGLYEYLVVCDETTNTPDIIDQNKMRANIFLKPTKAAEFIEVNFVLTSTGANFEEVRF